MPERGEPAPARDASDGPAVVTAGWQAGVSVRAHLTFPRIARAEWIKLRTLRSTWITLLAAIAVLILGAGLIANHLHGNLVSPDPSQHLQADYRDVLTTPFRAFGITQLIIGVLGVLAVSGEYATGMIRATFSAVPKRLRVLAAKLVVFGVLAFVAMLLATLAAFFVAQGVLGSYGVGLGSASALRVVVALAGYLALVGVIGLGVGFIVRSTAGGVAALVGILLVAPGILEALGSSWASTTAHYLPLEAGQAMFSNTPGQTLSPLGGTLVVLAWAAAAAVGAAITISTRDA